MWMLSSLILLFGCPTPPDKVPSNNTAQVPNNPPQGQPPQGANSGISNGNGQNPPPANPPPNQPTEDQNNQGNRDGVDGQPQDNPPVDGAPIEGEQTPDGEIPTPEAQTEDGVDAVQIQGEPPPQTAEPTPVKESLLIRVERIPSKGAKAKHTQEQLANEDHVTFTGEATCNDCEGNLVLRVVKFLGPNDNHSENNLLTTKSVDSGDFSVLIPKGEGAVALELLVDKNGDGQPSAGEYFAVIEMAGQLIPDNNRSGLDLNSTKRDFFAPAPIPGTQGPQ